MFYKLVFNSVGLALSMTLTSCIFDLVSGYRIQGQPEVVKRSMDWDEFHRMIEEFLYKYENSIEQFAQNEVCGTESGKIHFNQELDRILGTAIDNQLRGRGTDFFILEFVNDLCRPCEDCESKKHMLYNWVGLVYDSDNNKVIDNDERRGISVIGD